MLRFVLCVCLCAAFGAAADAPLIAPQQEMKVAHVEPLRPARLIKDGFLFTTASHGSKIRKSLRAGTQVYVTGDQANGRSEVWVEEAGIGWIPTSILHVFEPELK